MPTPRALVVLSVSLALLACSVESKIAPRAPFNDDSRCDPVASDPPPARHVDIAPPPERPEHREYGPPARHLAPGTVSLGFIGDDAIGRYPTVRHHAPAWSRPFTRSGWSSGYYTPTRHWGGHRR